MRSTLLVTWVLLLAAAHSAVAQTPPDPAPAIEALARIAFLQGTWTGQGWTRRGSGPKEEFTLTETVDLKLDGAVMLIEGVGHSKDKEARKGHHALAIIAFDPGKQR
ncbi:MAG: hypothetical protein ACRD1R_04505 [Acidobacteriota bacterium]